MCPAGVEGPGFQDSLALLNPGLFDRSVALTSLDCRCMPPASCGGFSQQM